MKENFKLACKSVGMMVVAYLLLAVGSSIGLIVEILFGLSSNDGVKFAGMYAGFIGIWIVTFAFCYLRKKNRYLFSYLGKEQPGNNLKTALCIGLTCGIGLNLVVAAVAMMHGDIALSFAEFNPLMVLLFIVTVCVQSGAEEVVTRWFIYRKLREYFPKFPVVAILGNSLFFAAIHLGNPGVHVNAILNIVFVAVLYSLIVYYYDSFWACVVAHTSWNFCQNILLGLPNSGIVSNYSIFSLDAANARDSFVYNTSFGIEGTLFTDLILLAACVAVFVLGRRKRAKEAATV